MFPFRAHRTVEQAKNRFRFSPFTLGMSDIDTWIFCLFFCAFSFDSFFNSFLVDLTEMQQRLRELFPWNIGALCMRRDAQISFQRTINKKRSISDAKKLPYFEVNQMQERKDTNKQEKEKDRE